MKADEIDEFEKKFGYKPTGDPDEHRHARGLRPQGQPDREPHAAAGRRDLLEDAQGRLRQGHPDLGRPRPDRRVGEQADQPLRPQLGVGHLRLLQGARARSRATTRTRSRSSRAARRSSRASPSDKYGIGYSGIGYKTADVRAVPLAAKPNGKVDRGDGRATPTRGEYPLGRFLYVYVNYKPGTRARPAARRVHPLRLQQGRPGDVVKDGYYPDPQGRSPTRRSSRSGSRAGATRSRPSEKPTRRSDGKQRLSFTGHARKRATSREACASRSASAQAR